MSTNQRRVKRKPVETTKLPASRETHEKYSRAKESTGIPLMKLTELAFDALVQTDGRFAQRAR